MTIKVSPQLRQQILQERIEYDLSGDIGGLPKTTYYTPDGRVIRTTANLHTNQAGGIRDANLDKGWLLSPPAVPKLFCCWCDRWHDTHKEVDACKRQKSFLVNKSLVAAKQEEASELSDLKKEVAELKDLLSKFMEVQNRQVLQSEANEPAEVPSEPAPKAARGNGNRTHSLQRGAK